MADRRPQPITVVRSVILCIGVLALLLGSAQAQADRRVVVLPTTGVVDQVMAGYLREGITAAACQRGAWPSSSSWTRRAARSRPRATSSRRS